MSATFLSASRARQRDLRIKMSSATRQRYSTAWPVESSIPPVVGAIEPMHGHGTHYLLHVGIGLESLAATEVAQTVSASTVTILQGKVAFRSDAPFSELRRLRSAESLSLLCWVAQMPSMPVADDEAFAAAFHALLASHVLPQVPALERAWRAATGLDRIAAPSVPFRVTARRSGCDTGSLTRQDLGRWLAEAWHDASDGGFTATAHDYELEILLQWSGAQVCIELPAHRESRRLTDGRLSARSYCPVPALHAPIGWALASLAKIQPGWRVLDPMCGRGGVLIEAALLQPQAAACVGCDKHAEQLEGAATNAQAAMKLAGAQPLLLLRADATRLPLADGSVDAVLSDMPFGRKHGRREGLYAAALQEWRRVLRPGGRAVLLTTRKAELEAALNGNPRTDATGAVGAQPASWIKLGRHHLMVGALTACAHVIARPR